MQTTAVPFRTELFFLAEDEMKSNRKFTSFDNPFKIQNATDLSSTNRPISVNVAN